MSDRAVVTALDVFYVDVLLTLVITEEELIVFIDEFGGLLSSRGFHLAKYSSISGPVLSTVPRYRLDPSRRILEFGNLPTGETLGVVYNAAADDFVKMAKIEERQ